MFDAQKEAIGTLWNCPEIKSIESDIRDMGVGSIGRYSGLSYDEERNVLIHDPGNGTKVKAKDVGRLAECFAKCIDGVRSIDEMMRELRFIRGIIAENVFRLRHAYRPADCRTEVMKLHRMASEKGDFKMSELRDTLAKILGLDALPEEIVGLNVYGGEDEDSVLVRLRVKGKPTTIAIVIPVEVDYRRRYDIPDDEEKFEHCKIESLESRNPRIVLDVFLGAASEVGDDFVRTTDCIESVCPDFKTLSERVMKAIGIDIRDNIKKIQSIKDVKTMEDFVHWRGLRAANNAAEQNDKAECSGILFCID